VGGGVGVEWGGGVGGVKADAWEGVGGGREGGGGG